MADTGGPAARHLRVEVAAALEARASLADVEREIIDHAELTDDGRAALWLYAWGVIERGGDAVRVPRGDEIGVALHDGRDAQDFDAGNAAALKIISASRDRTPHSPAANALASPAAPAATPAAGGERGAGRSRRSDMASLVGLVRELIGKDRRP